MDSLRLRVEHNARFAPLELPHDVRKLLFQGEHMLAIVRALAQHERLDHATQDIRAKLGVGDDNRLWGGLGFQYAGS